MRLNNYSYNYRFPKLTLKKFLTINMAVVYIRAAHAVSRTCDNEVGVVISIRDPYTSPFTSP